MSTLEIKTPLTRYEPATLDTLDKKSFCFSKKLRFNQFEIFFLLQLEIQKLDSILFRKFYNFQRIIESNICKRILI